MVLKPGFWGAVQMELVIQESSKLKNKDDEICFLPFLLLLQGAMKIR